MREKSLYKPEFDHCLGMIQHSDLTLFVLFHSVAGLCINKITNKIRCNTIKVKNVKWLSKAMGTTIIKTIETNRNWFSALLNVCGTIFLSASDLGVEEKNNNCFFPLILKLRRSHISQLNGGWIKAVHINQCRRRELKWKNRNLTRSIVGNRHIEVYIYIFIYHLTGLKTYNWTHEP